MSSVSAITIGNFDGVHLGHAELVRRARKAAGPTGRVIVLSFDPHPISILRPEQTPARLSDFAYRSDLLGRLGADEVNRLEPSPGLLEKSPREFLDWVVERYRPSIIVEGPDFRFGKSREGTVKKLEALAGPLGCETIVIDPVEIALTNGHLVRVSSSLLRWLIAQGRITDATILLGHPYELRGIVVSGEKRGRTIGVPTANLDHEELLLPADGVYAGEVELSDASLFPAAISVGRKPTFQGEARICEAHLIGYEGPVDHYGWSMRVRFHHWLRDQIAFTDMEALKRQLQRDIESAGSAKPMAKV